MFDMCYTSILDGIPARELEQQSLFAFLWQSPLPDFFVQFFLVSLESPLLPPIRQ